jgi:hypothetical protein
MTPCACSLQQGELTAHDDKFQQEVKALAEVHAAESHRMTHPAMSSTLSDNAAPVGYSNSNVPMVKTAQDWQGKHAPDVLGGAWNRSVLLQR